MSSSGVHFVVGLLVVVQLLVFPLVIVVLQRLVVHVPHSEYPHHNNINKHNQIPEEQRDQQDRLYALLLPAILRVPQRKVVQHVLPEDDKLHEEDREREFQGAVHV